MTTEATRITDQPLWWDIWDGRGPFFLVQMVLNPNLYEIFLVFPGSIGHIWLNITYLVQFYRIITNSVMKNVNRRTWCAIRSWRTLAEITIHDGLHSGKHQLIHGIFFYQLIYCFFYVCFFWIIAVYRVVMICRFAEIRSKIKPMEISIWSCGGARLKCWTWWLKPLWTPSSSVLRTQKGVTWLENAPSVEVLIGKSYVYIYMYVCMYRIYTKSGFWIAMLDYQRQTQSTIRNRGLISLGIPMLFGSPHLWWYSNDGYLLDGCWLFSG